VAPRDHRTQVETQLYGRAIGKVILQPADRGTAAGLFLPLSFVRARDPKAVVVIQPSDHFVYPEERFLEVTRQSIVSARRMPERLVLLGVPPDRLETEYGWIQLGPRLNGSLWNPMHSVSSFLEQPGVAQADAALRAGSLWNTSVLAATMESLWQAGWACFPDMMPLFEQLAAAWKTHDEPTAVEAVYQEVPAYNISSQLLERRPDLVAVVELSGVLWSDWGKPERIAESIRRIGGIPAFPPACLNRPFAPHPVPQTTQEVVISA
jgi:mannose-1-phosphate guanylyltransferase